MVWYEFAAFLLHNFDRVVQKEVYKDGVNTGDMELVDAVLFRTFLSGKLLFVYFLGIAMVGGMMRFPEVLGFHFGMLSFNFSLDKLNTPNAGGPEFDFPVGPAWDWFEIADVRL